MSGASENATALPTSEVVVAAHGAESMYDALCPPTGDTNHVLCRGQEEPLDDFGRRVEERLRSLRRKSSIRRVSYLLGPHAPQDWLRCRKALVTVIGLLSSGAEFELVAAPTTSVDVVRTLDELMPHAEVGVRISVRRNVAQAVARVPAAAAPDSSSMPGLVRAKHRALDSHDAWC